MLIPGSSVGLYSNVFKLSGTQAISSSGTSGTYAVNDILTLVGGALGPNGNAATVKVTSVSNGKVTGITIINPGSYSKLPGVIGSSVATTNGGQGGGNGTGFTLTPNWIPTYWTFDGLQRVYATFDPTNPNVNVYVSLGAGNLNAIASGVVLNTVYSTIAKSDKRYCEFSVGGQTHTMFVGINNLAAIPPNNDYIGWDANGYGYSATSGFKSNSGQTAYGATYTTGDFISVVFDGTNGTINFWKNGVDQGQAFTGITGSYAPCISIQDGSGSDSILANFGASAWKYSPPAGYVGWF